MPCPLGYLTPSAGFLQKRAMPPHAVPESLPWHAAPLPLGLCNVRRANACALHSWHAGGPQTNHWRALGKPR
eukprot:5799110-Pyramimonas_sp.AAC.1